MVKRSTTGVLALVLLGGCGGDPPTGEGESGSESETGDPGDGDGDGDPGDGDGDGDGDGEPGDGDGDGDPGDGDGDPGGPLDDVLTLDHVQVKGSHNSYHVAPAVPIHPSHAYTHPPLDVQLEDYGVRAFELDLHRGQGDSLYVYHIAVVDEVTTCHALADCLTTIKGWSDANPGHVPIMVWFEIKDSTGGAAIDDLLIVDQAILEVFPPNRVLTPDSVQGTHETLRDALETDGWPTLGQVRGKVMFMILNGDHGSVEAYTYGHTSLFGRMMFVGTGDFSRPYAAVSKINNPADSKIAEAHAAKIITASNLCAADQDEADCFDELAAGFQTGSHMLKDDFLAPGDGMTYFLDFPDGNPVRCNEVTAPPECTAEAIEDLP